MTKVSIILLNWNGIKDTIPCLKSLSKLNKKGFKLEVIVVDNGSTDSSVQEIQKLKITNLPAGKAGFKLKILQNAVNLGFAQGNNVGITEAIKQKSDYVLLLNNDTEVDKNLVAELLKSAKKHPEAAIFSPKIYFAKGYEFHKKRYKKSELGKVIWYAGGKMDWNNVFGVNVGVDEVDKGQYDKEKEIDFATGACMFIRAEALKRLGAFDKRYFTYFEDAELSQRYLRSGYKILYVPRAILWHKVAQSSSIGSNLNDYFITRNRLLFGMKYAPLWTKQALIRQNFGFLISGRKIQKQGVKDYIFRDFGKGSWK
jgi:hypothetical protein